MVEFESLDAAKTAKDNLFGCDIYSGCCTLKIEYAKPTKLNVYKNDADSFDYTNPNPGKTANQEQSMQAQSTGPQRPVLLKEPLVARGQVNGNGISHGGYENGLGHAQMTTPMGTTGGNGGLDVISGSAGHHGGMGRSPPSQSGNNYFRGTGGVGTPILATPISLLTSGGQAVGTAPTYHNQGSVCMVYGLNPDKMNANRLFNLFCLYGNVTRVKFLKTKEGCAMVQLGDSAAVERAISNLNNTVFFGTKMQLGFSKQAFLADVQSPYQLSDGTPSFQDFMGSKNNRFMNPEMASKNRIQPPSKILHFFNTPPGLDEHEVEKLFMEHGAPQPKCVKMFPSKTDRSSSGLIEFINQSDALEGLVCCYHLPVNNPSGKFPYIMKLCFSSSRNIPATMRQQWAATSSTSTTCRRRILPIPKKQNFFSFVRSSLVECAKTTTTTTTEAELNRNPYFYLFVDVFTHMSFVARCLKKKRNCKTSFCCEKKNPDIVLKNRKKHFLPKVLEFEEFHQTGLSLSNVTFVFQ